MVRQAAAFITSPKVPRYEEAGVSVRPISAPRAQALGPDAYGAGIGEALTKTANASLKVVAEEKAKADRTAVISSRTALDQTEVDLLYNPKEGALAKRGKDAFGVPEPTLKAFDEKAAEIERGLASDEQKKAFRLVANDRRVEVDKQLQRHVFGEMKTYSDEANKAALSSTLNNVSTFYQDPERVDKELKFGQALIMSDTDNKGKPPEYIKLRMDAWRSQVHEAVVDRLVVDNAVKAQEYFDKNRDGFLPSEAAKIEKTLKPLATKQIGMDAALNLAAPFASISDPVSLDSAMNKALTDARTGLKGNKDALDIAEVQIKQMAGEREKSLKVHAEAAAAPVFKKIAEIQGAGRAAKLSDIPAADWAALVKVDPKTAGIVQDSIRRELQGEEDRRERLADRQERKADRAERKAERGTMAQLMNWAALNADPASLANANLDKMLVTGALGREHYKSLTAKQAEIANDPDKHTAIRSESQTVEDVLGAGKIKKGSEDHSLAWNYVEDRKKAYVRESGKQPTRKEIEGFAREALYQVDVEGSIFDRPAYKVDFEDIPRGERAKIVDAFKRRGRAFTQGDVVQAYALVQAKKGAK